MGIGQRDAEAEFPQGGGGAGGFAAERYVGGGLAVWVVDNDMMRRGLRSGRGADWDVFNMGDFVDSTGRFGGGTRAFWIIV